jgi:hypothetical protein
MGISSSRIFLVSALVCFGFELAGQTTFGTIVGSITDNSNAVVPDAQITLVNLGTSEQHIMLTSGDGQYRFVNLVPGEYRLTVERRGFQRAVRQPIEVDVQADVRVNFRLQVGEITETLDVGAAAPLLDTENASVSTEIDSKQVTDLALNGRNVLNLIELAPGVVPGTGAAGNPVGNANGGSATNVTLWMNYQIGGGQTNQSAAFLDGAPIKNPQDNTAILVPVQDSVQEFRIVSNDVSAEFGRFAGGVVNLVTKAGTNQFHGGLYEYLRNKDTNANYFYNNLAGLPVPEFTQNQYGAYIGGPVKKDKLFFFFSWENYTFREQTPSSFNVPTAAMRAGNFSAPGLPTIYDPLTVCGFYGNAACPVVNGNPVYTRQPFPNNIIPASRLSPQALLIEQGFSLPNAAGTGSSAAPVNNYFVNQWYGGPQHQYVPRFDYNWSDKQRIFGRYSYWNGSVTPGEPFNPPAIQDQVGFSTAWQTHNAVIGDNYMFSPTAILDVRLAWSRFSYQSAGADLTGAGPSQGNSAFSPTGPEQLARLGPAYVALESQMALPIPPRVNIQNFFGNIGGFNATYSTNDLYTMAGDVTKIMGRHSLKFGGETRLARWDQFAGSGAGTLTFNNLFTSQNPLSSSGSGYGMADFLLGLPTTGTAPTAARTGMYEHYSGLYITDTYHVLSKLTMTAGVRWDLPGSWAERHGVGAVFDPSAPNPLDQTTGLPLMGVAALFGSPLDPSNHLYNPDYKLFAPRVGVAYQLTPGTVIRAGYAISYTPLETTLTSAAPSNGPAATGTTTFVDSLNGGITPSVGNLANPYPKGLIQPAGANGTSLFANTIGQTMTIPLRYIAYPYVRQWNFNIGREFGPKTMVQVGYEGLKGTHLPMAGSNGIDINQLPDQFNSLGRALLTQVPNPFAGQVLPGGTLASSTINAGQLLRPYPEYQNIGIPSDFVGFSNYQSLQAVFERRLGAGGTINVAYTWSKLLSNTDSVPADQVQDYNNLAAGKSLSADNVPQRLTIAYTGDLPFGRGKALVRGANRAINAMVSGWGINGITILQSGLPLSLSYGGTNDLGLFGAGTIRPNVIAGCNETEPGSPEQRATAGDWYNVKCFTAPASVFSFGDEPRVDPILRQQGIINFDVALRRIIPIRERYRLEMRAECFNIANHPRFGAPGTVIGTSAAGQIQSMITSQANTPRIFQFVARLSF